MFKIDKKGKYIMGGKDIDNKAKKGGLKIFNSILESMISKNDRENKKNKDMDIKMVKASKSKDVVFKKGGGIADIIFPAGLSGAAATLALAAAQHSLKKKRSGKK